jgi:hypothetical protein
MVNYIHLLEEGTVSIFMFENDVEQAESSLLDARLA